MCKPSGGPFIKPGKPFLKELFQKETKSAICISAQSSIAHFSLLQKLGRNREVQKTVRLELQRRQSGMIPAKNPHPSISSNQILLNPLLIEILALLNFLFHHLARGRKNVISSTLIFKRTSHTFQILEQMPKRSKSIEEL